MPRTSTRGAALAAEHEAIITDPLQDSQQVLSAKRTLRTHWKWAYVSHFLYVFEQMLGLAEHLTVADLENDLAAGTTAFTPRVLVRLLTCLTHDRKTSNENYQSVLYKQYLKRAPEALPDLVTQSSVKRPKSKAPTPFQPEEDDDIEATLEEDEDDGDTVEEIDWLSLSLEKKLDVLHEICEWHFANPTRLRSNMKFDDDLASWRIEPIGFDASHNSYYLLGGDRIWIQRSPPRKPRKSSKKAKAAPMKKKVQAKPSAQPSNSKKRPAPPEVEQSTTRSSKRIKASQKPSPATAARTTSSNARPSRAAAADANKKLAALPKAAMTSRATRNSRRGALDDEVWQEIPEEWLRPAESTEEPEEASSSQPGEESERDPVADDAVSELTALSELSDLSDIPEEEGKEEGAQGKALAKEEDAEDAVIRDERSESDPPLPADAIEWETLVVTLQDWELFPLRFEKSTNYLEKAFYKLLMQEDGIVQAITENLRVTVKKQQQEEALNSRKRSSRLAIKEIEKEEAKARAVKEAEEHDKLDRARRAEARARKEDDNRRLREEKREARRRAAEEASATVDVVEEEPQPEPVPAPALSRKTKSAPTNGASKSKSKPKAKSITPIRRAYGAIAKPGGGGRLEDWEMDCELCGTRGVNLNDGHEIACCERCGKWQHIWCWDQQDKRSGLPPRNWAAVAFRCRDCTRPWRAPPPAVPTNSVKHSVVPSATDHPSLHYYNSQQRPTNVVSSTTPLTWHPASHAQYPQRVNYPWDPNTSIPSTSSHTPQPQNTNPMLAQHPQPSYRVQPQVSYPQQQISLNSNYRNENYGARAGAAPPLPAAGQLTNGMIPATHREHQSPSMIAATYGPQPIGSSFFRSQPTVPRQSNGTPQYSAGKVHHANGQVTPSSPNVMIAGQSTSPNIPKANAYAPYLWGSTNGNVQHSSQPNGYGAVVPSPTTSNHAPPLPLPHVGSPPKS